MPVIFKSNRYLQAIARNSKDKRDYSFSSFGLFWGVSTTLIFYAIGISINDVFFLARVFNYLGTSMQWVWVLCSAILFLPIILIAPVIVCVLQFKVTAPLSCCCGKKSFAHKIVTCVALGFDMAALQLLCHHVAVAILAIPAAPLIIVTFMLLFVLLSTWAITTFAFFWTLFAKIALQTLEKLYNWCKNSKCDTNNLQGAPADNRNPTNENKPITDEGNQRLPKGQDSSASSQASVSKESRQNKYEDCAYLARVFILIPSLMAVVCFSVLLAFSGKYVNTATRQDNFASLLLSFIIPLLLSGIVIGTQVFICKWLKIAKLFQQAVDSPYEQMVEDSPQGLELLEQPQANVVT